MAGGQFAALCVLPDTPSRWTYVLDTQRLQSTTPAAEVAARQLTAVLSRLSVLPQEAGTPLLLGDGAYGTVTFLNLAHGLPCEKTGCFTVPLHRVR